MANGSGRQSLIIENKPTKSSKESDVWAFGMIVYVSSHLHCYLAARNLWLSSDSRAGTHHEPNPRTTRPASHPQRVQLVLRSLIRVCWSATGTEKLPQSRILRSARASGRLGLVGLNSQRCPQSHRHFIPDARVLSSHSGRAKDPSSV